VSKVCRDACIAGYSVGRDTSDVHRHPRLIDYSTNHILSYDIEVEFVGPGHCSHGAPILCMGMVMHMQMDSMHY